MVETDEQICFRVRAAYLGSSYWRSVNTDCISLQDAIPDSTPVATASASHRYAAPGDLVKLTGSVEDSKYAQHTLEWTQTGGTSVTVSDDSFVVPDSASHQQTFTFRLKATNGDGNHDTDDVSVVALTRPVAVAEARVEGGGVAYQDTYVDLDASDSMVVDSGDPIYAWSRVSGPGPELSDTVSEASVRIPEDATAGLAVYSVTVSCRSGCTGNDTATVSFNVAGSGPPANSPPAVAISGPATVSIGTTTTFSASASDAETSASDLWHQWSILSAYAGMDFSEDETASSINVVVPNYEVAMMPILLNLEVCDEGGYFAPPECTSATVVIEVIDANAFSVDAGSDVSAQPGDVVQLSGSVSGVTTGLLYQWSDHAYAVVSETTSYSFTVPADARSGDTFTFIAHHSDGRDSYDDILITVSRPIFTVNAGFDQTAAPGDTITLTGSAANALGAPTYEWSQTSGPSVTLSGANTLTASFTAPEATPGARLAFDLYAQDSAGERVKDSVAVTLRPQRAQSQSVTPLDQNLLDLIRTLLGDTGGTMNISVASDGTITITIPPGS